MTGRLQAGDTRTQVVWRLQNQRARSSSSWSKDVKNYVVSPEVQKLGSLDFSTPGTREEYPSARKKDTFPQRFVLLIEWSGPQWEGAFISVQSHVAISFAKIFTDTPRKCCNRHVQSSDTVTEQCCLQMSPATKSLPLPPPPKNPSIFEVYNFALGCIGGHLRPMGCMACLRLHSPASVFQLFFISI